MPTVLRVQGFRVSILTNDHNPAHVHVTKAGKSVKIDLEPVRVSRVGGMALSDIVKAVGIVEDNLEMLLAAWGQIYG